MSEPVDVIGQLADRYHPFRHEFRGGAGTFEAVIERSAPPIPGQCASENGVIRRLVDEGPIHFARRASSRYARWPERGATAIPVVA